MRIIGSGEASAINSKGVVVGRTFKGPFVFDGQNFLNISDPAASLSAINSSGLAVGLAYSGKQPIGIILQNGAIHDLNDFTSDSNIRIIQATGINRFGQIAGTISIDKDQHRKAVLILP
jgi:hypothetical protein